MLQSTVLAGNRRTWKRSTHFEAYELKGKLLIDRIFQPNPFISESKIAFEPSGVVLPGHPNHSER
jgi:hypothetical protein